jgi:magnesium chelatase subunit I
LNDAQPAAASLAELKQIQGLLEKLTPLNVNGKSASETTVSAAEFLLEGMTAHKRISRAEERVFTAAEKKQRVDQATQYAERMREREQEEFNPRNRTRRGFN